MVPSRVWGFGAPIDIGERVRAAGGLRASFADLERLFWNWSENWKIGATSLILERDLKYWSDLLFLREGDRQSDTRVGSYIGVRSKFFDFRAIFRICDHFF
ncbi:hypothetical protein N782_16465 [Pontibacillus yanchengensis Y32]|uniref:Uncharacterized protein n=1 Tax=Pontibacillus yanchengensis Y32 TaxID=1385514 RepID=A0A0A2T833_9BACI|nr:hypothetical protein N782_16465 [Pontibacillus yanchengensis Y32]